MAFNPRTITKELDFANLAKHNDNYADIKTELDAHDAHIAAQTAHGSTAAATPGAIMQRDSEGRAKVAAPAAADDIARKAEVDAVQDVLDNHIDDADVHLSEADRNKLDGIEPGAEPNQNAFAQVNNVVATSESDTLTIAGGTGITVSTNPATKTVTVTATGEATPGPHGSSHDPDGSDPIPELVALRNEFDALTPASIGAETPAGAQAKVDALAGEGNTKTVAEVAEDVAGVTAQLADLTKNINDRGINVKQPPYNAKTNGIDDDTDAIKSALADAVAGDIVYLPKGIYKITNQITVPKGVTIQGCGSLAAPQWVSGTGWDLTHYGTVFAIDWGAGGSDIDDAAFLMDSLSSIVGCNFWYPSQNGDAETPTAYPPTIAHVNGDPEEESSSVVKTKVDNCLFVNPYIGMQFTRRHELLHLRDIFMAPWQKGLVINASYDIDRLENVHMNPNIMYRGEWPGTNVITYQRATTTTVGFELGKADQMMMSKCFSYGFDKGLYIHTIDGLSPNGILIEQCGFENGNNCIVIEETVIKVKLHNVILGTHTGTAGNRAISINLVNDTTIDEIVIDDVSIFRSAQEAVYIRGARNTIIDKLNIYEACINDPGFSINAVNIANCVGMYIKDSYVSLSSNNSTSTNFTMTNVTGFVVNDLTLSGQKRTGASELYLSNCTKGRVNRIFITNSQGTGLVGNAGGTDVVVADTLAY